MPTSSVLYLPVRTKSLPDQKAKALYAKLEAVVHTYDNSIFYRVRKEDFHGRGKTICKTPLFKEASKKFNETIKKK